MLSRTLRPPALRFVLMVGIMSFFADFTYEGSRSAAGPITRSRRRSPRTCGSNRPVARICGSAWLASGGLAASPLKTLGGPARAQRPAAASRPVPHDRPSHWRAVLIVSLGLQAAALRFTIEHR